ncbi:MAG: helix-turn-helix domain-containing protein [Oscillospiraceae bacterium]|nr:helix-turn-helix domain-containing protein [Oscillospiraceae bacterium]
MLAENLKILRKLKGFSQEELAVRLNVVRQTVSKWEKGLSVPDAELIIRLSEVFEMPVSVILDSKTESGQDDKAVTEQLSRLNENLAIRNRYTRRAWKVIAIVFAAVIVIQFLIIVLTPIFNYASLNGLNDGTTIVHTYTTRKP